MFVEQVAKGLVGELMERLHRLAPEQVERLPGLRIEFHELAPRIGRLLGHDDLLASKRNNACARLFIARGRDGPRERRRASTLPRREGAGVAKSSCARPGNASFAFP